MDEGCCFKWFCCCSDMSIDELIEAESELEKQIRNLDVGINVQKDFIEQCDQYLLIPNHTNAAQHTADKKKAEKKRKALVKKKNKYQKQLNRVSAKLSFAYRTASSDDAAPPKPKRTFQYEVRERADATNPQPSTSNENKGLGILTNISFNGPT